MYNVCITCVEYLDGILLPNIFAEYFYRLFMTTICCHHPIINGLIGCNICAEYFVRIFMLNIYGEYLHLETFSHTYEIILCM